MYHSSGAILERRGVRSRGVISYSYLGSTAVTLQTFFTHRYIMLILCRGCLCTIWAPKRTWCPPFWDSIIRTFTSPHSGRDWACWCTRYACGTIRAEIYASGIVSFEHCPRSLRWVHRVPKQTIHITLIMEPKCHTALYAL